MFCVLLGIALSARPNIVPQPVSVQTHPGTFKLQDGCPISYDPSVDGYKTLAEFTAEYLARSTGFTFKVSPVIAPAGISFQKYPTQLEEQEYQLQVDEHLVSIYAVTKEAAFYGLQSFLQLLPAEIYSDKVVKRDWEAQCSDIHDKPRFTWRGIMIDTSRHFCNVTTIKKIMDVMAIHKLNVFHLHLTDDQGWRFESKKYPKLQEIGSYRKQSPKQWDRDHKDGTPYGPYFFTQDELRDLVKYAERYYITILPELEMPGHTLSGLAAYPEYSCTGGPFEVADWWGATDNVFCPGNDQTFVFIKDLLEEIMDIFPSKYIHCGGDEVGKGKWANCAKCQKRKKDLGLQNEDQLQSWFMQQFANYLDSKGRHLIGWDEILNGGLPDGAAVMSWTGPGGGQKAAELHHNVVMTPQSWLYIDFYQFPWTDPFEYIHYRNTCYSIYKYDPRDGIKEENQKYVVGTQCNLWQEFVYTGGDETQYKIWPRCVALSEMGWCEKSAKNYDRWIVSVVRSDIARIEALGAVHAPVGQELPVTWKPDQVTKEFKEIKWDLGKAAGDAGAYCATFVLTSGTPLQIKNVKLILEGQVILKDEHTGNANLDEESTCTYHFQIPENVLDKKLELSAEVKSDGNDSVGEICFYLKQ